MYFVSGHNTIYQLYFRIIFLNCQTLWGLNLDLKVEIFGKLFGLQKLIMNCTSDRIIIQTNIANGSISKYEFQSFRLNNFSDSYKWILSSIGYSIWFNCFSFARSKIWKLTRSTGFLCAILANRIACTTMVWNLFFTLLLKQKNIMLGGVEWATI